MPILTTASFYAFATGAFFGSIFTNLAKSLLDFLWTTDCFIQETVKQNLSASDPINLDQENIIRIIPNDILIDTIISRIKGNSWGIFVFAAPEGTGKSTFIKMVIQRLKLNDPSIYLKLIKGGSSVLQQKNLCTHLKIPSARSLSDFLPSQTVIFIDQIDFTIESHLNEELRLYLTELATDSSNSRQFKIILCVSNAYVAAEILKCNGFEKIQPLCPFRNLAWNDAQLDAFIEKKLPNLPTNDKIKLKRLATSCKNSPGLIHKATDSTDGTLNMISLKRYAKKSANSWEQFESRSIDRLTGDTNLEEDGDDD